MKKLSLFFFSLLLLSPFTSSVSAADTLAPTIVSVSPVEDATGVPVGQAISIVFSEAMNPNTINNSGLYLTLNDVPVSGSVSYSGVTATLTPSSNLSPQTYYLVNLSPSIADLAGNQLNNGLGHSYGFQTGGGPVDNTPPVFVSSTPPNGSTGIFTGTDLSLVFSEKISLLSVSELSFYLSKGGVNVPGNFVVADNELWFTPLDPLLPGTEYVLHATTDVTDLAGNNLASPVAVSFTTATETVPNPPSVVATVPQNNATGVVIGANIEITFSEPILLANGSVIVRDSGNNLISGNITENSTKLIFNPSVDLDYGTEYTVVVSGIEDYENNAMTAPYQFIFTTEANPNPTCETPVLTSPADKSVVKPGNVTFAWQPMDGANGYVIQISDNSINTSQSSYSKNLTAGTYYWKVKAAGKNCEWSETRMLSVKADSQVDEEDETDKISDLVPSEFTTAVNYELPETEGFGGGELPEAGKENFFISLFGALALAVLIRLKELSLKG